MTVEPSDVASWLEHAPDSTLRVKVIAKHLNVSVDTVTGLLEELHMRQPGRYALHYDVSGVSQLTQAPYFGRVQSRSAAEAFLERQQIRENALIQLSLVTDTTKVAPSSPFIAAPQRTGSVTSSPLIPVAEIAKISTQTPLRIIPPVSYERVYRTYSRSQMISGEGLQTKSTSSLKAASSATLQTPAAANPTPPKVEVVATPVSVPVAPVAATPVKATPEIVVDTPTPKPVAKVDTAAPKLVDSQPLPVFDINTTSEPAQSSPTKISPAIAKPAKSLMAWFKPKSADDSQQPQPSPKEETASVGDKRTRSDEQAKALPQPAKKQPSAEEGAEKKTKPKPPAKASTAKKAASKPKPLFNLGSQKAGQTTTQQSNLASLLDGDDDEAEPKRNEGLEEQDNNDDDADQDREARFFEEEQQRLTEEATATFTLGEDTSVAIANTALTAVAAISKSPATKRHTATPTPRQAAPHEGAAQPTLSFAAHHVAHPGVTAFQAKYKRVVSEVTTKENGEYVTRDLVKYLDTSTGNEIEEAEYKRRLAEVASKPVATPNQGEALASRPQPEGKAKPTTAATKPAAKKSTPSVVPPAGTKTIASFFGKKETNQ